MLFCKVGNKCEVGGVAGDVGRPGVASDIINWCLEHCESLRADTHADNKIMQHILEKNGFTKCGIIHVADGTPRIAYQRLSREGAAR